MNAQGNRVSAERSFASVTWRLIGDLKAPVERCNKTVLPR